MKTQFFKENQAFFHKKILLAASAGVDSQVLLHLLTQVPDLDFGVAHVDHQLRPEAVAEAAFLREYCQSRQIPFYETRWQTIPSSGVEEQARIFRYHFFEEVMQANGYEVLFTAHHADDQAETILMRFIRGGTLTAHGGIKKCQPFATGKLIRPLLQIPKAALYQYASEQKLTYYEDESNASDAYLRNRIRHHVMPALKKENSQVLQHFNQFSQQVFWAEAALEELLADRLAQVETTEDGWQFQLDLLPSTVGERYYFFTLFFRQHAISISQNQLEHLLDLLAKGKSQWSIDLEAGWQVYRSYHQLGIEKPRAVAVNEQTYFLTVDEPISLSATETVCLKKGRPLSTGQQLVLPLTTALPLVIRRRKNGDRIKLSPTLTKKVSRYLIDQKVPQKKREQLWVVTDANDRILALLPLVNSYLSIGYETDRIHYILEYNTQGKN